MNFKDMSKQEIIDYVNGIRKKYEGKIAIPAHHYQNSDLVDLSDLVGDSYKLAVDCAKLSAEFVVFCGVRFMAEGAAVLAKENQRVLHPDPNAGCPMADMISEENAKTAFDKITKLSNKPIVPIVYMNSYVDMKAFCGERGGTVCTSSNANKIVKYYLDNGFNVFFSPDHKLGINTARELGLKDDEICKIKRDFSFEGNPATARMFLWDGFCHVHVDFNVEDVAAVREKYPEIKVIVHPECIEEVVNASDISGSTQKIYNEVINSSDDVKWAIGTEINFVQRLADNNPNKVIVPLRKSLCHNMAKINLVNLAEAIESIDEYYTNGGKLINEVFVKNEYKENAKIALEKMIEIVES